MANSREAKYTYATMEEALAMCTAFEKLFTNEGVYISHTVTPFDDCVTLIFTIKTHDDTNSTS